MENRCTNVLALFVTFLLAVLVGGCGSNEAPKEGVKPHKDSYKTYPGQRPPGATGSTPSTTP
ncbi:MAG: hypothetical protein H7145_04340 [Akkermansiaceae bacterium]|nr:hypothetical protein [Armatimonadota bacterium]